MSDVEVDIRSATEALKKAGVNVHVAQQKIIVRLLMIGERFMKQASPIDTGYLRGSIHSIKWQTVGRIRASAKYAMAANIRSHSPRYYERTRAHLIKVIPIETNLMLQQALKDVSK